MEERQEGKRAQEKMQCDVSYEYVGDDLQNCADRKRRMNKTAF